MVRQRLHLEPGDRVYFDVRDDGSVVMVACNEPVENLFGMLRQKAGTRPMTIEGMNPASLSDRDR